MRCILVTDEWRKFFRRILAFCARTCQIVVRQGRGRNREQSVSTDIQLIVKIMVVEVVMVVVVASAVEFYEIGQRILQKIRLCTQFSF